MKLLAIWLRTGCAVLALTNCLMVGMALPARGDGDPSATRGVGRGLALTPPPGWQVTVAGEAGLVMHSPDADAWPIEVAAWPIPAGADATPAAAATAQETALFRLAPYARTSQREFTAAGDLRGLLVVGQIKPAPGPLRETVFVAYAVAQQFVIVGTFGEPGQAEELLRGDFGAVARSLTLVVAAAPAGEPVKPPTPTPLPVLPGERPTALPTLPPTMPQPPALPPTAAPQPGIASGTGLKATPDLPAPATPVPVPAAAEGLGQPGELAPLKGPLGVTLRAPSGWQARVLSGRLEVVPEIAGADTPAAGVFYWLWGGLEADQDPVALGRTVLGRWELVGGAAPVLASRQIGRQAFLAGTVGAGTAARRLVVCCSLSGDTALLSGFFCQPDAFADWAPLLARAAASLDGGPWWAKPLGYTPGLGATLWSDPDFGVLQVPVPSGWRLRGRLQKANGVWTVALDGVSEDKRLSISWQQPALPLYRELTPVLANLGWQIGDRYVGTPGEAPLKVQGRLGPELYLRHSWQESGPGQLNSPLVERLEPRPEVARLLQGEEAAGVVCQVQGESRGGPRQRLCLAATALAPESVGANAWQAGLLQAEGPPGAVEQAGEVLRAVVAGAGVGPGSPQVPLPAIQELLGRAQKAIAVLPDGTPSQGGRFPVWAHLRETGQGSMWLLPPLAGTAWGTVGAPGAGSLPELVPEFWK